MGWVKNLSTSTLTFNISQFFSSFNHHLLSLILGKVGFDICVIKFFFNYLVERKTYYFWNNFSLPSFNINVEVGQGSALSSILSALYLLPFLHILEKWLKNLKIPISFLLFVDDSLSVAQSKSFQLSNSHLFCSYNVASILLLDFVEYSKTEIFHFSRSIGLFNPLSLNLSSLGGSTLCPKETWKYLGFIFDRKLSFHQHINFYSNKFISMVKCMKILGNSVQGLSLHQKWLLYRSCVLPIALYGFQLWYYNNAPLTYPLKLLGKMQRRAAIWILGTFKTSPSFGVAGLILHLKKLSGRSQLRTHSLSSNHILHSLMEPREDSSYYQHPLSLGSLTRHQHNLTKGSLVDMDNWYNEVFSSFNPLHPELLPGNRVIDIFSDCFSFHPVSECNSLKDRIQKLDKLAIESSEVSTQALIITDASVKNNVATSISHIHIHDKPIIKTLHHASNVMSTEAELFAISCGINQATNSENISRIIVIMDSLYAGKIIFDPSLHPF